MPWDAVNAVTPHPAAEKLRVVLRVRAAVEAIDEDVVAEHLLRPSLFHMCIGILSMQIRTWRL
jgi:hypothetical protein